MAEMLLHIREVSQVGALEQVRARGLKVEPKCPFVAGYIGKHPEFSDLLNRRATGA